MRHRPTLATAALLMLVPAQPSAPAARAYAWDARAESVLAYRPDASPAPTATPEIPDGGDTTGEKSSRPPVPPDNAEEVPEDPAHTFVPPEAIDVPEPRARLADVRRGTEELPPAVAATREKLMAAARTGDIEALRPLFAAQRTQPRPKEGSSGGRSFRCQLIRPQTPDMLTF